MKIHPAAKWLLGALKNATDCVLFIVGAIPALAILALQSKAKQPKK